ncbi:hypothetical protein F5Y06DRAFT_303056 [Hypoxylon sp. FL0890]|nr:hypothetical protein F5Y06DRAFT_303056 [Hypoxylon sp. FL0890]
MMVTIYSRARRVITYTGEDTCSFDSAMGLAAKLVRFADRVNPEERKAVPAWKYQIEGLPHIDDESWDSLRDFLSRPWFTRKWILQESVVNPNSVIMCGRRCAPWSIFIRLGLALRNLKLTLLGREFITPASKEAMMNMVFMRYKLLEEDGPKLVSLSFALALSRGFNVTDPRDCIFAVASLVNDIKIDVDYTKSPRQVFVEATAAILERDSDGDLFILSMIGINKNLELPSWVPDWSVGQEEYHNVLFGGAALTLFKCGGSTKAHPKVNPLGDNLLGRSQIRYKWAQEQFKRLSRLGVYPTGIDYMEAFWRTIISNVDVHNEGGPNEDWSIAPNALRHGFEAFVRPLAPDSISGDDNEEIVPALFGDRVIYTSWKDNAYLNRGKVDHIPEDTFGELRGASADQEVELGNRYYKVMQQIGNTLHRLCTTSEGFIGLVHPGTQLGDVIVCFEGAHVPFTIRPTGDGIFTADTLGLILYHVYTNDEILQRLRKDIASVSAESSEPIALKDPEQLTIPEGHPDGSLEVALRAACIMDQDLFYGDWRIPAGTPVG